MTAPAGKALPRARAVLVTGAADGSFPGAVLWVARRGEVVEHTFAGVRQLEPERRPLEVGTLFDIASVTKPVTSAIAMRLVARGALELSASVAQWIPELDARVTVQHLLQHTSGLAAWSALYREAEGTQQLVAMAAHGPLEAEPGTRCLYSNLGFIVLGAALERMTGKGLRALVKEEVTGPLELTAMDYKPVALGSAATLRGDEGFEKAVAEVAADEAKRAAAETLAEDEPEPTVQGPALTHEREVATTERCPWRKRFLVGEVHDENCAAMGGVAGHAGLFSTAEALGRFGEAVRRAVGGEAKWLPPELAQRWVTERPQGAPKATYALGWDTPTPGVSSAGRKVSMRAAGHLGYTGCSIWIDFEREAVVALVTNRVHPTRRNDRIRTFRPRLHDAVFEELDALKGPVA